jgi:hypothetical protein
MWILKNSKDLLENLKSHDFSKIDSVKRYDFSTLYITILHNKLKFWLFQIIDNCFFKQTWHQEIQISNDWETRHIFCEAQFYSSEADIKSMLRFLVDTIYAVFGLLTIRWHPYGHLLCSFIFRRILIFT